MDFYEFIIAIEHITRRISDNYDVNNKFPAVSELVNNIKSNM